MNKSIAHVEQLIRSKPSLIICYDINIHSSNDDELDVNAAAWYIHGVLAGTWEGVATDNR